MYAVHRSEQVLKLLEPLKIGTLKETPQDKVRLIGGEGEAVMVVSCRTCANKSVCCMWMLVQESAGFADPYAKDPERHPALKVYSITFHTTLLTIVSERGGHGFRHTAFSSEKKIDDWL
jgi:hypothetical protein